MPQLKPLAGESTAGQAPSHPPPAPNRPAFPHDPDTFLSDPRVSYSKLDGKYVLEEPSDDTEWEWNESLDRWMPVVDEEELARQSEVYRVQGINEEEAVDARTLREKRKKRMAEGDGGGGSKKRKGDVANPPGQENKPKNKAVYVTNLPPDITVEELSEVFSRYGVIAEELDSKNLRIKIYTDEQDMPKGDALVVYFRPESVRLAVQMLDDSELRPGDGRGNIRVKEADWSYKKSVEENAGKTEEQLQAERKQRSEKEKKKAQKKREKMISKLADWSDDEELVAPNQTTSKTSKTVVLKHMFTLDELEEDPAAILDIKEDIRDECSKLGNITNVVLFDKEPEGIATIRYTDTESAEACVKVMHGRHFGGRQVIAYIAQGNEKFHKTPNRGLGFDDEDEEERLEEFGEWLEKERGK
ncbi:hypothetical protein P152DRAFT_453563 [Eremomyces bilateralis CBS 781.70]|uniref:RRM domain-containing protein n=1 Tax=Eremomyces bilateralis CBS 781.70 TaxID=1392243 RepID=A0A6G1GGH3_9PEZI|nr:uncharacterized protein P152DRAFT_453563 [Eremomyces bilateralis CBS 781.70]KAF1816960.1 hypothetical protein P152DRAFT_453563 [Eremomyces bilateralis CBS 781.70]